MTNPLYFIPGTMCDARLWRRLGPYLADQIVHHCDYTAADTIDGMAAAVLDQAPDARSHLIGFSLGGYLAIEAAVRAPHRFKSLTIIAASPYGLTNSEKELRHRNADMLKRLTYRGMSKARLRQFVNPDHLEIPEITGTILEMEKDLGQQVLIRQLIAPIDRPDISGALLALKMPVHFIMAEDDQLVPIGATEKLAAKSETITLTRLSGCGHMIPLEAPKELAEALQSAIR